MRQESVRVTQTDCYLFGQGNHYEIYKKLGAHPSIENGVPGTHFAVWAPNAIAVHVIGEWNDWNETAHPMKSLGDIGVFELFVPEVGENVLYKYLITTQTDGKCYKADPYANYAEHRPGTASKTTDLTRHKWKDARWIQERAKKNMQQEPMAVYECHIGSWMKHPREGDAAFYNYREFATHILAYLKEMQYTHIELMGIAEHPFDGSWGYQVTGYYAPTSRYGSPEDFMYLVDKLHQNGIGVILDWVPAHFPKDAHGLAEFDGFCVYEHEDPRAGEHPEWGTKIFNLGRNEVQNFLIANALFWLQEYHIDGLRVDAVASMLYLDYGKEHGQWIANEYGGNENLDAIEFFRHLNSTIKGLDIGAITIAEESTAWPNVTRTPEKGGLGFDFKWNMGWMHDFCEYMKLDPYFRKGNHYKMTFAMSYNSSENYIMPLSHDEVVHLKCSMVNKMPGYRVDKFANLRVGYAFMFGHEGKKLLFMGQDFGQESEWNEEGELDWKSLQDPFHKGMFHYVKKLLMIYRKYPCLYEIDNSWDGFEWMNADDAENSVYTFIRKSKTDKKKLLFVLNMTPMRRESYVVGVNENKVYHLCLNSDEIIYGGTGCKVPIQCKPEAVEAVGKPYSITLDLPAYAAVVYEY
ncbi:MAG: 1,4-alpha-glucan branching protein GlgB [Eubacteriales bacterium]